MAESVLTQQTQEQTDTSAAQATDAAVTTDTAAQTAATTAAAGKWYDGFADPEVKTWTEKLNVPSAELMAKKAYNLEKFLGADKAGRGILLPKDEKDEAALNAIYDKLGRPAKPEEYQLPVPEGQSDELAKTFAPIMHKLGLTKAQAVGLTQAWNEKVGQMAQQDTGASAQEQQLQINKLKQDWGTEYEANADLARRALKTSGLSEDKALAIEKAIGIEAAAKLFAHFGKSLAEPTMIRDATRGPTLGMTPEGAKMRISELMSDRDWAQKYITGDKSKLAEMERLQKISLGLA